MAIDEEKAGHVADLAMIGLTPDEIRSVSAELNSVLDYFERIREAAGSKDEIRVVAPARH